MTSYCTGVTSVARAPRRTAEQKFTACENVGIVAIDCRDMTDTTYQTQRWSQIAVDSSVFSRKPFIELGDSPFQSTHTIHSRLSTYPPALKEKSTPGFTTDPTGKATIDGFNGMYFDSSYYTGLVAYGYGMNGDGRERLDL
ncbi:hypothetical protein ABVT39_016043 [Epinephelus coioides]